MDFIFNLYLTFKILIRLTLIPFVIPFVQFYVIKDLLKQFNF